MFLWTWILYLIFIRDTRVQHKYSLSRCIYGFVNIACSASCQLVYTVPTQTSTRNCSGASLGVNCNSQALTQTENCNVLFPGFISAWGACSASCQLSFTLPTQTRNSQYIGAIFNGSCNGAVFTYTQNCNEQVYCPGTYGAWSSCSESCQSNHIRRWLRCFSNYGL
ncbi:semaphorin-5B-like isoform X2 [Hydra vulgaris]|uniref:Semaphorin-5B-like isoform X2 n=1 Tax=Hydra vulgaris TaxID=6087 RepID=A0ABM4BB12_HYDVU